MKWDERKRRENIRKHGIDFAIAPEFFSAPLLVRFDTRQDYGEDRWVALGLARGRIVVVVYTERDNGEIIRIISVRKALQHERKCYEQAFKG